MVVSAEMFGDMSKREEAVTLADVNFKTAGAEVVKNHPRAIGAAIGLTIAATAFSPLPESVLAATGTTPDDLKWVEDLTRMAISPDGLMVAFGLRGAFAGARRAAHIIADHNAANPPDQRISPQLASLEVIEEAAEQGSGFAFVPWCIGKVLNANGIHSVLGLDLMVNDFYYAVPATLFLSKALDIAKVFGRDMTGFTIKTQSTGVLRNGRL